ncbi:NADH-ubiquinone oxidoreductase chain 1 [Lemmus lemmus]
MAFLTLVEEKILGYIQLMKRPNIVGPYGISQPFADAIKLFIKKPLQLQITPTILFLITSTSPLSLALSRRIPLPITHPQST